MALDVTGHKECVIMGQGFLLKDAYRSQCTVHSVYIGDQRCDVITGVMSFKGIRPTLASKHALVQDSSYTYPEY